MMSIASPRRLLQPKVNMAVEPLAMCYAGLAGRTFRVG
jgi:hypothetical protein